MLTIDGGHGEGGGQILRTALALSAVTQTPFRICGIRAGRHKPGLLRQHLTSVQACAQICGAQVSGAELGSRELSFQPGRLRPGRYHFAIGTAGSTTLVLQTVLYGLLFADGPSDIVLTGGTHNPHSPPFDFLARSFLPLLRRMGAQVSATLTQPGFYPAGGGQIEVHVEPAKQLSAIELTELASPIARRATAMVSNLPRLVGERELAVLASALGLSPDEQQLVQLKGGAGPGNVLTFEIETPALTTVFSGFGEKGVRAETVAEALVQTVQEYLRAEVPVDRHLADQLLLPLALTSGGAFRTLSLSPHAHTQLHTLRQFLAVPIAVRTDGPATVVQVGRA